MRLVFFCALFNKFDGISHYFFSISLNLSPSRFRALFWFSHFSLNLILDSVHNHNYFLFSMSFLSKFYRLFSIPRIVSPGIFQPYVSFSLIFFPLLGRNRIRLSSIPNIFSRFLSAFLPFPFRNRLCQLNQLKSKLTRRRETETLKFLIRWKVDEFPLLK